MTSEYVLRIPLERHVINTRRAFPAVVADIRRRVGDGPPGLVCLAEFDVGGGQALRFLLDLPAVSGDLVRFLPDTVLGCPMPVLVQRTVGGGTRLVYDSLACTVAVYQDDEFVAAARALDAAVMTMLRQVAWHRCR